MRRGAVSCGEPGASATGGPSRSWPWPSTTGPQGLWQLAWQACHLGFSHAGAKPDGGVVGTVDSLFVDAAALQWSVAYEASIAAWYVGEVERGRRLTGYLLSLPDLPAPVREAIEANRRFYQPRHPLTLLKAKIACL